MLSIVRLSPRFQITIPQDVRESLRCESGDRVAFRLDESGRVYLENLKAINVETVRGMLKRNKASAAEGGDKYE
ncbi:type II toxin-antitoxin system PrlF family antitoxin [Alicyclobacillus tolerans]|uniref:AbrB/MazE/SpoVT family DNA-binding domain-containing protein n=1 Tax=Alicyclobacillus tolerans TaxID=90970 RepID=UPI003556AAC8|nr:type II toxin-antitoxin system PrlF family antitoxin [Alicyclobacillus tolerans]